MHKSLHVAVAGTVAALLAACGGGSGSSTSPPPVADNPPPVTNDPPLPDRCLEAPTNSGYCLVWQDEFEGEELDSDKWGYERDCFGGGNNEAQCYVDSENNVWVEGGLLRIRAIREDATGPAVMDSHPDYDPADTSGSGTYTSGRLRTLGLGDWKYGRFEISAKMPWGQGTWPAIWMLPSEWAYGGWAGSGEIDIMEAVNLKVGGEDRVHGTLHYGGPWPGNVYSGEAYSLPGGINPADGFHQYAIEWEEGEIRWYVDGHHYATQTSDGWYSSEALDRPHAPFDQAFHLILNLAVGGDWAGNVNDTGVDESVFPQEMQVEYVRVYQCTEDFESGSGCASRGGDFVHNPGHTPPQPPDESSDRLTLFDGAAHAPYVWGTYTESGSVDFAVVDAGGDFGQVGQITYNTDDGIGFFQSPAPADLSGFTYVEFDLRVLQEPEDAFQASLVFRSDCVWPCTSGNYPLDFPPLDTWTRYQIPILELENSGLDPTQVNTPFVISPGSGNQRGVVLQVDNVALTR